ncbi:MAG: cell division protein FtsW [Clostridia bacterium]|nr:cell division protein FtsW [Clostridia bacterium]
MKTYISNNVLRKKEKKHIKNEIDKVYLILILVLLAFGTAMVFSASYPNAVKKFNDGFYYLKRQVLFLLIGLVLMYIFSNISTEIYEKFSPYYYGICIVLLIIVLFGGFSEGVAKRWLGVPGTSLSFQPSELMKLGIILIISYFSSRVKKKGFLYEIVIPGILLFLPCALVLLEKHLSGTLILVFIGLSLLFMSGISVKKMVITYGSVGIAGAILFLITNEYAMKRILSFINPSADILSDKWQTTQGLYAIGSGGFWGKGFFNSVQKFSYVSEPQNDFIFTIWCEEMGYIGAIFLIALYALLIWRGFIIAYKAQNFFDSMLAFGITMQVGIQTILNMLVVTDLIPNTGISLPFFSYGGSSLVILLFEMGIMLSISRKSRMIN